MDLQRWETPFATAKWPSVFLIPETEGDSTVTAVVAPSGIDKYPKYLVRFSAVCAFSCEEEAGGVRYAGALVGRDIEECGCSYIWRDSPQAAGYALFVSAGPFHGGRGPVVHYVLFGGDYDVGIIAAEPPVISVVEHSQPLRVTYEI
jgi:hypothetical protein